MRSDETLGHSSTLWPIPLHAILPSYDERAVLVGRTGSGKTTLAEHLLRHFAFVAVLDPKGRIRWQGYDRQESFETVSNSKHSHVIYAPTWEALQANREDVRTGGPIAEFFAWVYRRENTMMYVDEVMSITRGDEMPDYYLASITRGREIGIGTISSTQRPKRIPQVVLSEAEHYYAFALQLSQDRERLQEVTGELLPLVRGHEFTYKHVGDDRPFARYILNIPEGEISHGGSTAAAETAPTVP